ncbi:hypothetical protein BOTCAL_0804g00010 [Botryotinia calthae]|uniref:BTB domain-containing protein n=1 Tax=Botryotinia calthae TaxID=38488 RepID=A0A4Y8CFW3_9HELO|nr:hypothetical protein BOTCAL_0804g00010 [Botryotinia calthae]
MARNSTAAYVPILKPLCVPATLAKLANLVFLAWLLNLLFLLFKTLSLKHSTPITFTLKIKYHNCSNITSTNFTRAIMDQTNRQSPKLKKFSLPDQTPDTRFVLFDEIEIQLHSTILKIHSAFFRKFLDSPDKKPAEPSAEFRYEWVSEIEEDGDWHLVENSMQ